MTNTLTPQELATELGHTDGGKKIRGFLRGAVDHDPNTPWALDESIATLVRQHFSGAGPATPKLSRREAQAARTAPGPDGAPVRGRARTARRLRTEAADTPAPPSPELDEVRGALLDPVNFRSAGTIDADVPEEPGLYAVRIRDIEQLPEPYVSIAEERESDLLYIGIARRSLRTRLLDQELRARGHGSLFRSLGALLGYRPARGSLLDQANQRNFVFTAEDEARIIEWINANLIVNWLPVASEHRELEEALVEEFLPLLNLAGNPASLPELSQARAECLTFATTELRKSKRDAARASARERQREQEPAQDEDWDRDERGSY